MALAKWTKKGNKLDASRSSERQEIDRTVLEIVNPSQEDLGSYTCEASNSEGAISEVLINKENNLIPASVLSMEEQSKEYTDAVEEKMEKAAEALVTTEDHNSSSINTISSSLVLLVVFKNVGTYLSHHH
jgi:ATP-dependent Zn protease